MGVLSAFPGIRVDIVGVPPLAVGVLSASVGMFNEHELVHVMHYVRAHACQAPLYISMYTAILQSCHFT